jgi:hypothetical protein
MRWRPVAAAKWLCTSETGRFRTLLVFGGDRVADSRSRTLERNLASLVGLGLFLLGLLLAFAYYFVEGLLGW